jgi:hypothetical protein
MATKIIHKKSSVTEKVPLTTDLEVGELAINLADKKLFTKDTGNSIISLGNTEEQKLPIKADVALAKGDFLYATGTVGASGKITVNKFIANNTIEELYTVGVAEKDFAVGDTGFAVSFGEIKNINTTGSTVSETWIDGTILYSSATTSGKLTNVKPTAPNQSISVAIVVRAHATTGILFVRPIAGFHLDELHDVSSITPTNGQPLTWNSTTSVWNPSSTITASTTGSAATLTTPRTIAISGDVTGTATSFDGSANISISSAITAGAIVNADINASAAIADTKLATISTAGKVSNSATTATNANTASAIVARDASGNFSAGTVTAALSGNATTATTWQTARNLTVGNTAKSVNGSVNVAWSLTEIGAEAEQTSGVPRANLGTPTVREAALFDAQFTNKTDRFNIANIWVETSTDNVTWTDTAASDVNKRRLVGGDVSLSGIVIPYNTPYFRIRFRATSYVYLNSFYSYFSGGGHSTSVQVFKKHDSGAWTQHTSSTAQVAGQPGHIYLPFSTIPFHPTGTLGTHFHEVYVLFTPTWNGSFPSNNIAIYNNQWWGGYPTGRRNVYSTDEFGNVDFPAAIGAANGTAAEPAYDFTSDTNTGMYLASADTLGFATNGTAAAQFTSAGNLRLFNTAGTFYSEFSNQPTANRTITIPDGNVTLTAGTMATTTDVAAKVSSVTGTAPIVSSGGITPAISISAATTSAAGSMSAADKTKLDGIAAGAQVNVATNISQGTRTTTTVPITSSTGTGATLDIATTSLAGVMSSADKTKLDGIAANANNYVLPFASTTVTGGGRVFSDTVQSVAANAVSSTASRTYGTQPNAAAQLVVNVPWTDTVYTLPAATSTALGGVELFSDTVQTTAANAVTTTASRTYGIQVNAAGQAVVNVPWTDANWYPTAYSWTDGTTAGPTGSLTGAGMTAVSFGAIPSASDTASGIVTTGTQTFAGAKTFTTVTATDFNTTSDVSLKENIEAITSPLAIVTRLRGVSFNWKEDNRAAIGLIAQEVEKVLPEVVTERENGTKAVAYANLVAVLIEAVKELKEEIELLKAKAE